MNGWKIALGWNGTQSHPIPLPLPSQFEVRQLEGPTTLYPVQTEAGLRVGIADHDLGARLFVFEITDVSD